MAQAASPLHQQLAILRRRSLVAGIAGGAVLTAGLLAGSLVTPLYEAKAKLVVERERKAVSLAGEDQRSGGMGDDAFSILNTHCELIGSKQVVADTVAATGLAGERPYNRVRDPALLLESRLRILPMRDSWIIDLALRDEDPERAKRVLAALLDTYFNAEVRRRGESASGSLGFLREQAERARTALEAARSREQLLYRQHGVVGLDANANHLTAELSNLNLSRVRLAGETAASDAIAAAIAEADAAPAGGRLAALLRIPELRRELVVAQAMQAVAELEERRAALTKTFKDLHPRMIEIDGQLAAARTRLDEAVASTRLGLVQANEGLHRQAREIDERIAAIQKQVSEYRENLASLKARSEETSTAERLYQQLLQRLNEEEVNGRLNTPRVSTAERPNASADPVNVKPLLFAIGALAAGLAAGLAAANLAELVDRRARDPASMPELATLRLLASLPAVPALPPTGPQPALARSEDPRLAAFEDAVRVLRSAAQLAADAETGLGVLSVCSAARGDGRTTVAVRLAAALAASGRTVLLVDGDLARPGVSQEFGLAGDGPGLADLLGGGEIPPQETGHPRLSLLPAGTLVENAAELLHGARLPEAVAAWRAAYEVVVIDCGPLDSAEALEILDAADRCLLVVRDGHTPRPALHAALARFEPMPEKLLGLVANAVAQPA